MLSPGEMISGVTLAVLLFTQVWDRDKARFKALEDSLAKQLAKQLAEIKAELNRRIDRQEADTDELRTLATSLDKKVAVLDRQCRLTHKIPDSAGHDAGLHVSHLRREVAR